MSKFLSQFWQDEAGISSVEYAVLLAFLAAGVAVGAQTLGEAVSTALGDAADCVQGTSEACGGAGAGDPPAGG
ncbi:MAG: Flp family type IVb pilin [Alphaproteobacteria bacterium]|nr:Flp family type IVb pilin [Alphaproteobacteria bacterium]